MKFSRVFAMPSHNTFSVKPIGDFVDRWSMGCSRSIDPFARDCGRAHVTNDLNPSTTATFHMEAVAFLELMAITDGPFDLVLFDPPYSPRQISEYYAGIGKKATMQDTQSSFWKKVKDAIDPLVPQNGIVLSFGWNSQGMGLKRGYRIEEILMVAHGGAHNDTICLAERKL